VQQKEPLGRLHSFLLCVPGQLYFIPRLILQNTNGEEMQVDILAFQALPSLSRSDLSYVAGEFRIFGAIFLEDPVPFSNVTSALFELGKVLYCEVFNFVGGQLLLNRGALRRFLQKAKVLEFVGGRLFLGNILLGGFDGLGFSENL
jgi:hypothetical protein